MQTIIKRNHPVFVDFFKNRKDFDCALLGSLGFSTRCIQTKTGYSKSQITYRLHKCSVRRSDYRDGISPVSKMVIQQTANVAPKYLKKKIRQLLQE